MLLLLSKSICVTSFSLKFPSLSISRRKWIFINFKRESIFLRCDQVKLHCMNSLVCDLKLRRDKQTNSNVKSIHAQLSIDKQQNLLFLEKPTKYFFFQCFVDLLKYIFSPWLVSALFNRKQISSAIACNQRRKFVLTRLDYDLLDGGLLLTFYTALYS